jgi:hypothetical protein
MRAAFKRGEQRDGDVLLSDVFAGREALRHHAEGAQERLDDNDQQGHGRTGSSLWQASSDAFLAATACKCHDLAGLIGRDRRCSAGCAGDVRATIGPLSGHAGPAVERKASLLQQVEFRFVAMLSPLL